MPIVQFGLCASLGELQGKKKGQPTGANEGGSSGSGLTLGLTDSSNQVSEGMDECNVMQCNVM